MVMAKFWKNLFVGGSKSRRRTATTLAAGGAQIERFETRYCLSVSSVFSAATGALAVTSNANDAITIAAGADGNVTLNGATLNPTSPIAASAVKTLAVTGGSGNNRIDLSRVNAAGFTSLTSVSIDGGAGNDNLVGSALSDNISGGAGNDNVQGGSGED